MVVNIRDLNVEYFPNVLERAHNVTHGRRRGEGRVENFTGDSIRNNEVQLLAALPSSRVVVIEADPDLLGRTTSSTLHPKP